jgi:dTDP-4-dehydrorhamnose reductase
MKVFIAGANGMLAHDLAAMLAERGHEVLKGARPEFDIIDINSVQKTIEVLRPDVVVNCAAYTAVDSAEKERELAFKINGEGPANLATVASEVGSVLVHISTDFVFDGKKNTPYNESDPTGPVNVYGESKLAGEINAQKILPGSLIVRTSWLYGLQGPNFVKTMIGLLSERESVDVVVDQVGCPTYTVDLASAVASLVEAGCKGIFHFSNEGIASWYDFAYEIIEILKSKGTRLKLKALRPVLTKKFPRPAPRPSYSVLDKTKYREAISSDIPHWRDALKRFLDSHDLEAIKKDTRRC